MTPGPRQRVQIAIFYGARLQAGRDSQIPPQWTRVGQRQIADNVVAADETVSSYGMNRATAEALTTHLRQFAIRLPDTVRQSGHYVD